MIELDNLFNRIERRVWITRGARFNAARRLSNKQYWSIASISFLSVYGISIPIIQSNLVSEDCLEIQGIYSAISIISSVFILVLSLLEGSKNYQVRSERLHKSALHLSCICRELEILRFGANNTEDILLHALAKISNKYENIVSDCQENHESEDYIIFRIQNRKEFGVSTLRAILDRSLLLVKDYWLYFVSIVVFPVPILLLYFYC